MKLAEYNAELGNCRMVRRRVEGWKFVIVCSSKIFSSNHLMMTLLSKLQTLASPKYLVEQPS